MTDIPEDKTHFVDTTYMEDDEKEELQQENPAFMIAQQVLEQTDAGFVIVGSPIMLFTPEGQPFPDAIGISINFDAELTKATLAPILRVLADNLEEETNKISNFLMEATGNSEDSDDNS